MWNLKNKTNKIERLMDTENRLTVVRGEGGCRGTGEKRKGSEKYKLVATE